MNLVTPPSLLQNFLLFSGFLLLVFCGRALKFALLVEFRVKKRISELFFLFCRPTSTNKQAMRRNGESAFSFIFLRGPRKTGVSRPVVEIPPVLFVVSPDTPSFVGFGGKLPWGEESLRVFDTSLHKSCPCELQIISFWFIAKCKFYRWMREFGHFGCLMPFVPLFTLE